MSPLVLITSCVYLNRFIGEGNVKITYMEALEAQLALMELNKINLPIRASLAIARLSNLIDGEAKVFAKTRDKLVKDYSIIPSHTEREDVLSFSTTIEGATQDETKTLKESQLKEFVDKFHELLNTETNDLGDTKIELPEDVVFKPKMLKPLAKFIEVA